MTYLSFTPLEKILPYWPEQLAGPAGALLADIGITEFEATTDEGLVRFVGKIGWLETLKFKVPACEALILALNQSGDITELDFDLQLVPAFELKFPDFTAALQVRSELLRRVVLNGSAWEPEVDANQVGLPVEVGISGVGATISPTGEVSFQAAPSLSLTPFEIGTTGIIVETTSLQLFLDATAPPPAGQQPGFKGVAISSAQIHLTGDLGGANAPTSISLNNLVIGSSGFSGKIALTWSGSAQNGQLFGLDCKLEELTVEIKQNAFVGSIIKAKMKLPFFDQDVAVEIGYTADGGMVVGLKSPAGDPPGIYTLTLGQVLELKLDSLKMTIDDGLMSVVLSGTARPLVAGLSCPAIRIDNLMIDSRGRVNLPGGWLPLPQQYELKLHSFKIAITKFGFGRNDDGTKWVGLSGGIKLIDALPAGVSVEGLRIVAEEDWSNPRFTLTGVGVELEIKDVLYFKGAVAYRDVDNRFDGAITLELRSVKINIDGKFVVGDETNPNTQVTYRYMAIFVEVDLPTGVPLLNTGLAAYGMAGLFALRMRPDKQAAEDWYEIPAGQGWSKRGGTDITDINNKWKPEFGAKGFGVGMTFGTLSDNGYTFNAKAMFVAVFPGPLLLLSGAANLLKDRAKLGDDPLFRALAVYDRAAGTLQVGVDLKYRYNDNGKLITISAGTEAYYEFDDPAAWRVNLGVRTPTEQRIQARVFDLFDAKAYLMLSAHEMAMGAWVGYDRNWKFGPLKVGLSAWMESNVKVSTKPPQLSGDMALHGAVELEAFSFGLNLSVDAAVQAEVFKPKHILAELTVKLQLPSLRKKKGRGLKGHCKIEFGPDKLAPPIPIALKGVSIEHFKTSATWPLPSGAPHPVLLKPSYDDGLGFLLASPLGDLDTPPPLLDIPVVPMDCRPSLHFARNVHDDCQIGLWGTIPSPYAEWIGDPEAGRGSAYVRYALTEVVLEKDDGGTWVGVAGRGPGAAGLADLYGTWSPAPGTDGTGVAQNRLTLGSKSGFDSFRNTNSDYASWWATQYGGPNGFPCMPPLGDIDICLDFDSLPLGPVSNPFSHPNYPWVSFSVPAHAKLTITEPLGLGAHALCSSGSPTMGNAPMNIDFGVPARHVRLVTLGYGGTGSTITAQDPQGGPLGPVITQIGTSPHALREDVSFVLPPQDVGRVQFSAIRFHCLSEVCLRGPAGPVQTAAANAGIARNQDAAGYWSQTGSVLEPHTLYRLRITTLMDVNGYEHAGSFNAPRTAIQAAYFRTEGPPGLAKLTPPLEPPITGEFKCGLEDLTRYIAQTVPPTIPATGDKPVLPRPVFRAYDVGCVFNEDYVDLMYRLAGRDLQVLLYDRNNQPVRGRNGAVAVADNPWGVAEAVQMSASETAWVQLINTNNCVDHIDTAAIPRNLTLTAPAECLQPDMLYRARLMPLLLHEDFGHIASGTGRWQAFPLSQVGGAPEWALSTAGSSTQMIQTGDMGTNNGANADLLGTAAVLEPDPRMPAVETPYGWTDYRLAADLKAADGAAVGLIFRWRNSATFYLFSMDTMQDQGMRLCRGSTVLKHLPQEYYAHGTNYRVVIEAVGPAIKVWVDGKLKFDVLDPSDDGGHGDGTVGLHTSGTKTGRFGDVTVHDLTAAAPSVFGFTFTTSRFVNFQHLMHSHDDDAWPGLVTLDAQALGAVAALAVSDLSQPVNDAEAKAFEVLADDVLGPYARQEAPRVETYRLDAGGQTVGLLLRGPEPFGLGRLALALSGVPYDCPASLAPGRVKLVSAVIGSGQATDEIVTLQIRQSTDLTGWRLELRNPAAPQPAELDDPAAVWTLLHTFGPEDAAPGDAVTVRINAGPAPTSPVPDGARQLERYRNGTGQTGVVSLTGDSVDLRLVGSDGRVEHARRFFADGLYTGLGFTAVRKADGTALALFPTNGTLPAGALRLIATYRRNNRGLDHDSLILTETGDDDDEIAVIDVPTSPPKALAAAADSGED